MIDPRVAVEVNIRPATWADLELLVRWNSSVDRVVAPTLRRQERSEALVLLALIGPWPVGHLLVDFVGLQPEGATHLWHMGVHDTVRNRGVGTALIQVAEREASGRELRESALEVEKVNPDALRLYVRLGYRITGERDEVWPEPDTSGVLRDVAHPCWTMRKRLE